ncbi:hypothetical protein RGQ29_009183 [Quercus rubra]|uniref:RWP-RK domain-containing protein n=1 Tax=Quercus rubra TaxID=3512 RepID=A0AAN7FXP0_QUERU|nr:hypothetical protein RGQ29_009183 [Quercus rubra]
MADPSAIVPYINDPYNEEEEEEEEEDIQVNFMDDSNPTLADLSMPMPMHERNFDDAHALMANANHLFQQDPFLWKWNPGTPQTRSNSGAGAGPSNGNVNVEPTPTDPFYLNLNMEMRPLSTWPVSPIPFNCTYCHVLREIIFTNGTKTNKLEIHGRLGVVCHAILQNHQHVDVNITSSSTNQSQMFDFCKKSIEDVRQFLINYCVEQKLAGYVMVQDPLAFFYEAICVGLDWDDDDVFEPSPTNSGEEAKQETQSRSPKVSLAAQRDRAGKLTLEEVGRHFHLPIEEASRRMKLCPTVLKKICRRYGIHRWPYRKVKSIRRQISNLTASLNSHDAEARANAQAEIDRLQQELTNVYAGVSIDAG